MKALNVDLWNRVQRIVYPRRTPSEHPPFAADHRQGPKRQPASWLYHLLAGNPALRAQVLP